MGPPSSPPVLNPVSDSSPPTPRAWGPQGLAQSPSALHESPLSGLTGYVLKPAVPTVGSSFFPKLSETPDSSILNIHGRVDAEAPILWPSDEKGQLFGKDPDAGKD